jgi:hypothetical protein
MADQPDTDGLAARADETGQLLVRSGIEALVRLFLAAVEPASG